MSKHLKELIFIILSVSPLFFMSIISNILETPSDTSYEGIDRKMLMISNALFLLLFLVPYFVIRNNVNYNLRMKKIALYPLVLVMLSTIFFIIINSPIIEWNKEINFPEFLSSFELWAQAKEKQLEAVTIHLVSFENNLEYFTISFFLLLNFLEAAMPAAIGNAEPSIGVEPTNPTDLSNMCIEPP